MQGVVWVQPDASLAPSSSLRPDPSLEQTPRSGKSALVVKDGDRQKPMLPWFVMDSLAAAVAARQRERNGADFMATTRESYAAAGSLAADGLEAKGEEKKKKFN